MRVVTLSEILEKLDLLLTLEVESLQLGAGTLG